MVLRPRLAASAALALAAAVAGLAPARAAAPPPDTLRVGEFSTAPIGAEPPAGWAPQTFRSIPRHTRYTVVRDPQQGACVRAEADASASGLIRRLDLPATDHPLLRWRWKVERPIRGSDVMRKEGDDYAARIYVSFRYSPDRLSLLERAPFAAARALYGEYPPHAALSYIWDAKAPVGTVVPNPFTDRVRMVVVQSGTADLGRWLGYERDIVADYRRAFGEEPPPIAGIAIMTDADNTGETAVACYGDIDLLPRQ
jgi:hypothetical protein